MVKTNIIEAFPLPSLEGCLPGPEEMAGQSHEEFLRASLLHIGQYVNNESHLLPTLEERRFTDKSGVSSIDTYLLNARSSLGFSAEGFGQLATAAAIIGYRDLATEAVKRAIETGRDMGTLTPLDVLRILNDGLKTEVQVRTSAQKAVKSEEKKHPMDIAEHSSQQKKAWRSHARITNLEQVTRYEFPKAMTRVNQALFSDEREIVSPENDSAGDQYATALAAA
jgi:hypothetical protein